MLELKTKQNKTKKDNFMSWKCIWKRRRIGGFDQAPSYQIMQDWKKVRWSMRTIPYSISLRYLFMNHRCVGGYKLTRS